MIMESNPIVLGTFYTISNAFLAWAAQAYSIVTDWFCELDHSEGSILW